MLLKKWEASIRQAENVTIDSLKYLLEQIETEIEGLPLTISNASSWSRSYLAEMIKEFDQRNEIYLYVESIPPP